jgi:hypothetical protein
MNNGTAKQNRVACVETIDWIHVITCKSLDAALIGSDSWNKLRKMMEKWVILKDIWIAIENGVRRYTVHPKKYDPDNMPPEPPSPFVPTFNAPRNRLNVAFRTQSQIGRGNFIKGRLSRDWITCMDHHFQASGSKIKGQECITKMIMALWEHMDRLWTYRNNRYPENTNQQVAR